jgi:hypothetical protein
MLVTPPASWTFAPIRFSSTSLPIGIKPSGVLTSAPYGWQALHCCGVSGTPTLNHTGELKAAFWLTSRCVNSSAKTCASFSVAK